MPPNTKKVVIIGGGAAGVFSAYFLKKSIPGCFDVTLLEAESAVGGHAHSHSFVHDGQTVHIDGGAQFFSETAQPLYCDLLRHENLFGYVTQHDAGVSVWDKTNHNRLFWIPPDLPTMITEALARPRDWLNFLIFVLKAIQKHLSLDWTEPFGSWLNGINFIGTAAQDEEFRANIARPLMYQFGLVQPSDLDSLSARFVTFYFVLSLPWQGGSAPFRLYNCEIGPDGIMENLISKYGLNVQTNKRVNSITPQGSGYLVGTDDDTTFPADEVIFATNANVAAELLPPEPTFDPMRALLGGMPYVPVAVPICKRPVSDLYMPDDEDDWTVSNIAVTKNAAGDPTNYMLSVWFGPLRSQAAAADFTKSWGSPSLDPSGQPNESLGMHRLMVGTPDFMQRRDQLRTLHQGAHHLWYTGGWSLDYDTQNSSLKAAALVALALTSNCILDTLANAFTFSMAPMTAAPSAAPLMPEQQASPVHDGLPDVFGQLLEQILECLPNDAAVEEWKRRGFPT